MNLGPLEILVILVLALLVFGPKRLPEVGRQVGGALRELRRVQDTVRTEIDAVLHSDVEPPPRRPPAAADEPDHDADPAAPAAAARAPEGPEPGEPAAGRPEPEPPAPPEPGFDGPPGSFV